MLSDVAISALCVLGAAVVAGVPAIIAAVKATAADKQSKANAVQIAEAKAAVEEAKVAAMETSTKQDGMIKTQDEIHIATNGKLGAVQEELKASKQAYIDELREYKAEVRGLRTSLLEMAKQSIPQGSVAPTVGTTLAPVSVVVVPSDDPLPVTVVPSEDLRS